MILKSFKLKDLCDLQNGYAFKSKDYVDKSNTLCCRMSNIRPDSTFDIEYNVKYLPDNYTEKYSNFLLKDGDLVIAMTDMASDPKILGVPTIVDTKGYSVLLNQRVGKLFNFNDKQVYVPFLKRILADSKYKSYYKKFAGGGVQLNISKEKVLNLSVLLPSLDDQKRVAKILSDTEELIKQRKESIDLLDEFIKSTFLEMFGDPMINIKNWERINLKEISSKIGSGATPRGGKESYKTEGISLIRSLNVHDNEFIYEDLAFIDEQQADKLKNVKIEQNDVLFNITGASVCRCCVVPNKILPARVNQHVSIIRPIKEKLNYTYLCHYLISNNVKKYLIKKATLGGATREAITKEQLENLNILVPPIKLQNKFAEIVKKTEEVKADMQESLQDLENLYRSLSQKAFKGELDLSKIEVKDSEQEDYIEKKKIKYFMPKLEKKTEKIDITNISFLDFIEMPKDLQMKYMADDYSIETDFTEDKLFAQFYLKDNFRNLEFTFIDLENKFNSFFIPKGKDFEHEVWSKHIIDFLENDPPLLEQVFDDKSKTVKFILTDETFKA